nr:epoxide hydrolase=fragment 2 {EC 3.3.2.3} [Pseudomonas, AD1, Peptide Partial, 28 aa] [Pseudomonas]
KPDNIHGGFNYYRANIRPDAALWTDLDH